MSRLVEELTPSEASYASLDAHSPADSVEVRNFVCLALHQVFLRVGWIFKTESIVIPIFLRMVGGSPALLGWLPVLNRLGFSIPPLLYAQRLKLSRYKNRLVVVTTLAMAAPFALLSALWFSGAWRAGDHAAAWMPFVFLAVYAVFFCVTGMNQLGMHTLQGKLIRYNLRGRLFTAAVMLGAPAAVLSAWALLPGWLALPDGGFGWVFGVTALAFLLAGLMVSFTREHPDNHCEPVTSPRKKFHDAWQVVRDDPRARPIAILSSLVAANFMLFPHYQALFPARDSAGLSDSLSQIMLWVCVQNASTALVSLIAGPLADKLGNRAALRIATLGLLLGPLVSIVLAFQPAETARGLFWLVFMPLGFMPVTIKLLINYTLEAAPDDDHPRYVAAIGMCIAAPVVVLSPVVGYLAGELGCVPVFLAGLLVLALAFVQSLRLPEPRHG